MSTPSAPEVPLKQRVWAGRIPVVFSLDANEVTTLHAPRPFYVRRHRFSLAPPPKSHALPALPFCRPWSPA